MRDSTFDGPAPVRANALHTARQHARDAMNAYEDTRVSGALATVLESGNAHAITVAQTAMDLAGALRAMLQATV
jgi:hypothetical protein